MDQVSPVEKLCEQFLVYGFSILIVLISSMSILCCFIVEVSWISVFFIDDLVVGKI